MTDLKKRIDEFISSSANSMSRRKGKKLYEDDKFEIQNIDKERQIANFIAYGTRKYNVQIDYYQNPIKARCSCPYDWGGICKHIVGAALLLKDQMGEEYIEERKRLQKKKKKIEELKKVIAQSATPQSFPIGRLGKIDENFGQSALRLVRKDVYGYVKYLKKEENKMTFDIQTSNNYWSYYAGQKNRVVLTIEKGEVFMACNCSSGKRLPCGHIGFVIEHIQSELPENALLALTPGYKEHLRKKLSERTGIPLVKIKQYYKYDQEEQRYVPTSKSKGVFMFDNGVNLGLKQSITSIFSKKSDFSFAVPYSVTEKQEQLGYVVWFHGKGTGPHVIPISGKPTPDREEMKYIKNFANANGVVLKQDDGDKHLLGLIKLYESSVNEYSAKTTPDDRLKEVFSKFHDLLQPLSTREFLFFNMDNAYQLSKNVKKSSLIRMKVAETPCTFFLRLEETEFFYELTPMLKLGEDIVPLDYFGKNRRGQDFSLFGVFYNGQLWTFSGLNEATALHAFFYETDRVFRGLKNEFDAFYETIVLPLSKDFHIEFVNIKEKEIVHQQLIPKKRQLFLSELSDFILFTPQVLHQNDIKTNILSKDSPLSKKGDAIIVHKRDEEYEAAYKTFMDELHPEFSKQHYDEFYYLPVATILDDNWFFDAFSKFAEADIEVFGVNDLKSIKYSPHQAKISTGIKSGIDWFDVEIQLSFGDEQVKLSTLKKAIMRNERFVKLSDGKMGILPEEWFEKLQKIFRAGEIKKGEVKISKLRFNIVDDLFEDIDDAGILKELAEKKRKLKKFKQIKNVKIPDNIRADLRDYQLAGFNWMNFLDEFKWGGLLADDMGLGKTLQALAFIKKQAEKSKKPNLAIVPTSLLYNWENEISKFVPDLKYVVYHGGNRKELKDDIKKYQLIITSYGVVTNDIEDLRTISFNYIFLDESQAIKNMASKRYKAVRLLKARNRIAMTGTPIENNTFDLFSQMNFLNPGFLGMATSFKSDYSKPIDGKGDQKVAAELQKMIGPFLLRRTKEQVAKELPPKIEDYIYCEMGEEQMKVYKAFRNKYRDFLLNKIEEDGLNKSKLHVLEGLLKLRQICDSPALLADKEDYGDESVKIDTLLQHIREKTGNHKILIFSQFVKMLHLIRKELEKEGIVFEYLDGQCTPSQRNDSVNNFQDNEACRVFLISLKAGGTGLNLTAADYVYIVDPWWNPAVENQAIDRTHRIGQNKHIIAYRMICKDTVEEKIMKYQQRKLKVASDIVQAEESFMKSLSSEDITDLFG